MVLGWLPRLTKTDPLELPRFLGPGTGKTHLATVIGIRACPADYRTISASATEWVARLQEARREGRFEEEIARLGRVPLLIIDEVGYIPFDPEATYLVFSLISGRYERASLIITSNKAPSASGEIFGDEVIAATMISRLGHHAEILSLKGFSYRLKDRDLPGQVKPRLSHLAYGSLA